MVQLLSTLLLAGAASAQLTTSVWFLQNFLGTDKIGFVGSVVGVSGTTSTLALTYDNGTDRSALGLASRPATYTIAPSYFAAEETRRIAGYASVTAADAEVIRLSCTQAPTPSDARPACTYSYGPVVARLYQCQSGINSTRIQVYTETHTYSGRGTYSAGVETITRAYTAVPRSSPVPSWCSNRDSLPSNGSLEPVTLDREDFAMFQVVLTAGLEKLNATQGAGASSSGPTVTSSAGSGSASQNTGAAAPMKTIGPMVAGLGAAVAVFL